MLLSLLVLLISLAVLVWSSDYFVGGASATSRYFGVSPLVVGMIVVGFGTSAPELLVSVLSALEKTPQLALGTALGSNIGNIALILGITALFSPIAVQSGILKQELPILIMATLVAGGLMLDGELTRLDGAILILLFVGVTVWLVWRSKSSKGDVLTSEIQEHAAEPFPAVGKAVFQLVVGLVLLMVSAKFLVDSAVDLAAAAGVSELVIGLTIVAVGTSLPELASSLAAVRRNEHDMALGNVIGSNLFNLLGAVGLAASIEPFRVEKIVLMRDYGLALALSVLLLLFCLSWKGKKGIVNRLEGTFLVLVYVSYLAYLLTSIH
jgi:cation:H+ antiporter